MYEIIADSSVDWIGTSKALTLIRSLTRSLTRIRVTTKCHLMCIYDVGRRLCSEFATQNLAVTDVPSKETELPTAASPSVGGDWPLRSQTKSAAPRAAPPKA